MPYKKKPISAVNSHPSWGSLQNGLVTTKGGHGCCHLAEPQSTLGTWEITKYPLVKSQCLMGKITILMGTITIFNGKNQHV